MMEVLRACKFYSNFIEVGKWMKEGRESGKKGMKIIQENFCGTLMLKEIVTSKWLSL